LTGTETWIAFLLFWCGIAFLERWMHCKGVSTLEQRVRWMCTDVLSQSLGCACIAWLASLFSCCTIAFDFLFLLFSNTSSVTR
jgi:hypothetical protein